MKLIAKLLSKHVELIQLLTVTVHSKYNNELKNKMDTIEYDKGYNTEISDIINYLKINSRKIADTFADEATPEFDYFSSNNNSNSSSSEKEKMNTLSVKKKTFSDVWQKIFFGDKKSPGYVLLIGGYINYSMMKAGEKMKNNSSNDVLKKILKALTGENLDLIMKFWNKIDEKIFSTSDDESLALSAIKKGWEKLFSCTKKYIDVVRRSDSEDNYFKAKKECKIKAATFAATIEKYFNGELSE